MTCGRWSAAACWSPTAPASTPRPGSGIRARGARLAEPARPLHGRARSSLRAARPAAGACATGGRARHRGPRGTPGAAGCAHLRARLLRAVSQAVRKRRHGCGGGGPHALSSSRQVHARGGADPAGATPGPVHPPGRSGRLYLPRRARAPPVRRQVRVAALASAGALLRSRRLDRARGDRGLPPDEVRAGRSGAREPADQAVPPRGQQAAQAHRSARLSTLPARHSLPGAGRRRRAGRRAGREHRPARQPHLGRRAGRPAHLAVPAASLRAPAASARAPLRLRANGPLLLALPRRSRPERLPSPARFGAGAVRGAGRRRAAAGGGRPADAGCSRRATLRARRRAMPPPRAPGVGARAPRGGAPRHLFLAPPGAGETPGEGALRRLLDRAGTTARLGSAAGAVGLVERTQAACARRRGQEPVPVDEVDEVRIVASWIADHQPAELSLEAAPGSERIAAFVREQADSQTGGRPRPQRSMPAAVSRIDAGV